MNVAISELVAIPASSITTTVKFRTERGRLYTVICSTLTIGGTVRIRYFDVDGITKLDHTLVDPKPGIHAVGSDTAGTLELAYTYASNASARSEPLVVVKEITV